MTATILELQVHPKMTTVGELTGCRGEAIAAPLATSLTDLTYDLAQALNGAYWSFMLQGELEDAIDTALLRAALAETPTLSGTGMSAAY